MLQRYISQPIDGDYTIARTSSAKQHAKNLVITAAFIETALIEIGATPNDYTRLDLIQLASAFLVNSK